MIASFEKGTAFLRRLRLPAFLARGIPPKGLRYRLLGFFDLSVLVPTLLTGTVVMVTIRRSLLEIPLREQREIALRVSDLVAGHVGNVKKVLLTVASRGGFAGASAAEQRAALRDLMTQYPHLTECAVLNPQGRETVKMVRQDRRLLAADALLNRAGRDEFRRAWTGPGYVSPVFFTERDRTPQMFIAVPIGRRQGVLLSRLSLDSVWELVSEVSVGKGGYAYLVDTKGNLLAHPQRDRVLSHENMAERSVVKELLEGESEPLGGGTGLFHLHEGDEGEKVLAVHHRVTGLGWGVVVQRPMSDALAPMRSLWRRVAAVVLVLGGVLLAAGLSLVRKILEPLAVLQEGVQKIAQGDLKQRLEIHTDDEIQKLAEEFNKMAESLESAEELKRDLTHMIVHDLKSPLSGVLGSIDYVASGAIGQVTEEQKKILSLGVKSGKDLLRLIQNLLDMAKMEEGRLELRREEFSLLELAAECVDDLEAHIHRENKQVSVEVPKSLPKIWADRDLVYRVLTNLLTNALKHTSQGAEIAIGAGLSDDQSAFVLSVKDSGEGIPPEFIAKIFEKFGQAEAKRKKFRIGSGLGLTFCKLAVEAHGGRIWVESELGKGSAFFVRIPRVEKPSSAPGQSRETPLAV